MVVCGVVMMCGVVVWVCVMVCGGVQYGGWCAVVCGTVWCAKQGSLNDPR